MKNYSLGAVVQRILRPVYTGDFCGDFRGDFSGDSSAISNRPCKLAAILWRFRGDLVAILQRYPSHTVKAFAN